jgi:hypothetical protein
MCSLRFENNLLTFEAVRFASISKKTPLSKPSFAFVSLALPLLDRRKECEPGRERGGGVQSRQSARLFLQSSEFGPPHPSPDGESVPPPGSGGGGGGGGGTLWSGQTLWYSRCTCTLWGGGKQDRSLKETGMKRNRDEEEEREGWTTEEEGRRKIAFWNTSDETEAESLSQSGKALLPIHNFTHP